MESSDGEPLVTSISDFYVGFPYERLPQNGWLSLTLRPDTVVLLIAFYMISESLLKTLMNAVGLNGKSQGFRTFVAAHNLALAIFSLVVAVNSWSVLVSHVLERGWKATYCDPDGTLWKSGLGAWSIIFYISKFYEFIDTWILVIKVSRLERTLP